MIFKSRKTPFFLAFAIINIFMLTPLTYAQDGGEINVTDIPVRLASNLGVDTFAGQMICSGILMMIAILPTSILTRGKTRSWIPEAGITLTMMGIAIAIEWLPACSMCCHWI